jgi:hypothetical protein
MGIYTVTVQEAINRGFKIITLPFKAIIVSSGVLLILIAIWHPSWWNLLLFPSGILAAILYTQYAIPRWRIWAYSNVADIHQLQRSAELSGLLMRRSFEGARGLMSGRQRKKLSLLLERFSEEYVFLDDLTIPVATPVYSGGGKAMFTIDGAGVRITPDELIQWHEIENERIAQITFGKSEGMSRFSGNIYGPSISYVGTASKELLRFESGQKRFEFPLASLAIPGWQLDYLFYIYRGRFTAKEKTQP